jgi:putative ABC transport system ATP-binding protein
VEQALELLIQVRELTCLWVTHSEEQARKVANHVLALEAGRLRAWGTPAEVLGA